VLFIDPCLKSTTYPFIVKVAPQKTEEFVGLLLPGGRGDNFVDVTNHKKGIVENVTVILPSMTVFLFANAFSRYLVGPDYPHKKKSGENSEH
jgi:hypothetical protein